MVSSSIVVAEEASFAGASCAFGVFDGVHEGHRFIIGRAVDDARARNTRSIIITFDADPSELFDPDAKDKLMTNDQRVAALSRLGADDVAVISFDRSVAALAPDAFLDTLFASGAPALMCVGEDFRFGSRASGTVADLERWGRAHGMDVEGDALLQVDGEPVTSTRIRALLACDNVKEAAKLLGHWYELTGKVISGRQAGREMGICTANLAVERARLVPSDGVYAASALVDGKRFKAAVSIGVPITFEGVTERTIEAHILDFDEDIYGKELTLAFVEHLRPMIKFDTSDALIAQINEDIKRTRQIL